MKLEIQTTIPNCPYSMSRQVIETEGLPQSLIKEYILEAKKHADFIAQTWQQQAVISPQDEGENRMLRKANEALDLASAQKSVIIDALKTLVGTEAYDKLRSEVLTSDAFKALTLHSDGEN